MRLVTFLGADFADAVNDFLATNASRVTVVEEGQEHSLESYAVFQEYLQLVEGNMEAGTTLSLSLLLFSQICLSPHLFSHPPEL